MFNTIFSYFQRSKVVKDPYISRDNRTVARCEYCPSKEVISKVKHYKNANTISSIEHACATCGKELKN